MCFWLTLHRSLVLSLAADVVVLPLHTRHKVKQIIHAAGWRADLSFTSFRHGGLTETSDAELTDREIWAQSRHTTPKVLPKYVKPTTKQIASGTKKRRALRTKDGHLSE
jgi:hypothetical protein